MRSLAGITKLFIIVTTILLSNSGCKKDDDNGSGSSSYPRQVTIQYKVTSASGFTQCMQLQYSNESGGIASLNNVPLPFTKSITRTINKYDALILSFGHIGMGELKGEILVDNKVVATKSFEGNSPSSAIPGQVTHSFL